MSAVKRTFLFITGNCCYWGKTALTAKNGMKKPRRKDLAAYTGFRYILPIITILNFFFLMVDRQVSHQQFKGKTYIETTKHFCNYFLSLFCREQLSPIKTHFYA